MSSGGSLIVANHIAKVNPFRELKQLGSALKFRYSRKGMEINVQVHGEEAIPSESKTLTKTGKVSVKKLSDGKRMEIYQDHICGCVIRVARETLSLLPIGSCIVTAFVKMVDGKTGHLAEQPILSVAFPRATCNQINWDSVDPSDSMKNFLHRMKFKRSVGFEPIEPIKASELEADSR